MGVMGCFRKGCEEVMCRRYSDKYGYVCQECFNELVSLGPENIRISEFMETEKSKVSSEASEVYYNEIFTEND